MYPDDHDLVVADAAQRHGSLAVLCRLFGIGLFKRSSGLGDTAKILRNQGQSFRVVYVTGDGEHRIVGLIILAIERLQPLYGNVLNIGTRANSRLSVVMPQIGRREDALLPDIRGTVLSHFELIANHRHFAIQVFLRDKRMNHAVSLKVERPVQVLITGSEGLEIVGAVNGGGSVRPRAMFS